MAEEKRPGLPGNLSSAGTRSGRFFLLVALAGGAAASAAVAGGLLCRCLSIPEELILLGTSTLLWWAGSRAVHPALRPLHRALPLVLPLAGPILAITGYLFFRFFRKSDYLGDDPTYLLIFNPPRVNPPRRLLSLEEVLERDRKIVPAGDILRWGEIPLKQALIDRLAGGEITPRVIRILRGARNDPDEEVRLFATTILTRIEKSFQERIRTLGENPDPVQPFGALGRATLEYAESGLVGESLSRSFLRSALDGYRKALSAGEEIPSRELLRVGAVAAALRNPALVGQIRGRLETMGAREEQEELERIVLYESGEWERLAKTLTQGESGPLPEHVALWLDAPLTGDGGL